MTDTMLKVLDRRMAIAAQARELENNLAEQAYAFDQKNKVQLVILFLLIQVI